MTVSIPRDALRSIDALRTASEIIRMGRISRAKQARELSEFSKKYFSKDVLQAFVQKKTVPEVNNFIDEFWNFISAKYPEALKKAWASTLVDQAADQMTIALHNFMSPGRTMNQADIEFMEGQYALYRPFFVNEEEVMISNLVCGANGDPNHFEIAMTYSLHGEEVSESAEGCFVPYQNTSVLFLGKISETSAPFIFVITHMPADPITRKAESGEGVLLVGARGTTPSGYPISIRRVRKPVTPCVITRSEFQRSVTSPELVLSVLSRGITHWKKL